MKKITVILLTFLLMVGFSVTVFAAETAEIYFNKYSSADGKIIVDVDLSKEGAPCMLQFCVAYDSDVLDCVSAVPGNAFSGTSAPLINRSEGKIYFIWDAISPLKNGGTVLRIEFEPKLNNKTASVWIDQSEEFIIANSDFEEIGNIKGSIEIETTKETFEETLKPEEQEESSSKVESLPTDNTSEKITESEEKPSVNEIPDNTTDEGYSDGIEIDNTKLSVEIGSEAELKVSGTDKELCWFSSNEDILKVENGKIIPVAPGEATVTVMTEDGLEEAVCIVTVSGEIPSVDEENEKVLNVDSPRQEKEEGVSAWVWILIAVLGTAAVAAVIFIKSKAAKK